MVSDNQEKLDSIADMLVDCNSVFVVTGAGISAESGLPTYRGIGGLYNDENTEDEVPIEVALSGPMFRTRPEVTWKYLGQIEKSARGATFNQAHRVLAAMEQQFNRFWILTQNVDGFHSQAGSQNVIEIHGNMHRLKCTSCTRVETHRDYVDVELPPYCADCGQMMRPDVVLFEEQLPEQAIETLYEQSQTLFDMVISIGTSSYFPYILQPVLMAEKLGIPTVEINPGTTPLSDVVDYKLTMGAKDALNEIWNSYRKKSNLD